MLKSCSHFNTENSCVKQTRSNTDEVFCLFSNVQNSQIRRQLKAIVSTNILWFYMVRHIRVAQEVP